MLTVGTSEQIAGTIDNRPPRERRRHSDRLSGGGKLAAVMTPEKLGSLIGAVFGLIFVLVNTGALLRSCRHLKAASVPLAGCRPLAVWRRRRGTGRDRRGDERDRRCRRSASGTHTSRLQSLGQHQATDSLTPP